MAETAGHEALARTLKAAASEIVKERRAKLPAAVRTGSPGPGAAAPASLPHAPPSAEREFRAKKEMVKLY